MTRRWWFIVPILNMGFCILAGITLLLLEPGLSFRQMFSTGDLLANQLACSLWFTLSCAIENNSNSRS